MTLSGSIVVLTFLITAVLSVVAVVLFPWLNRKNSSLDELSKSAHFDAKRKLRAYRWHAPQQQREQHSKPESGKPESGKLGHAASSIITEGKDSPAP